MKSIAIFCGSSIGNDENFTKQAQELGKAIAAQGFSLIYGGGKAGLMGIIADSALEAGGEVVGVIPQNLVDAELAHPQLTQLYIVEDMHERKAKMSELADAFIAMPGGVGTLEEIFEQMTWAQLGLHQKPCAFFNVNGFYDQLLAFLMTTTATGFTKARFTDALISSDKIDLLLNALLQYMPPEAKWSKPEIVVEQSQ